MRIHIPFLTLTVALLAGADAQVYELTREQSVRFDNPRISPRLDWMVDEPARIDKQSFRTLQSDEYHSTTVYVRFRPGTSPELREDAHAQAGIDRVVWESQLVPLLYQVEVYAFDVEGTVNRYLDHPSSLYAEPNYRASVEEVTNDPYFQNGQLWGVETTGGGSDAEWAWDEHTGDSDFVVAIIDTGTQTIHADLSANIWTNPGEIPNNLVDDDGNGYIDDVHGWNVAENTDNVDPCGNSHGTHVAGTVGAVGNNGTGVVGVNWRCSLMILRCNGPDGQGNPCEGLYYTLSGLDYAVTEGARVSNNSYGSNSYSQGVFDAILASQAVGHLFVAAAGNDKLDNDITPHYPSDYDLSNIISVAAIDEPGNLATGWGDGTQGSNWGATSVDIGAPGDSIASTVSPAGYSSFNGTSMASPHVAGAVALVWSRYPDLQWWRVRDRILKGATYNGSLDGKTTTNGQLNVHRALGIWVKPGGSTYTLGTAYNPFDSNTSSGLTAAASLVPQWGTLNMVAGDVPLSAWNAAQSAHDLGKRPTYLIARQGTVRIGTP